MANLEPLDPKGLSGEVAEAKKKRMGNFLLVTVQR